MRSTAHLLAGGFRAAVAHGPRSVAESRSADVVLRLVTSPERDPFHTEEAEPDPDGAARRAEGA
jgi:hypothetical protein